MTVTTKHTYTATVDVEGTPTALTVLGGSVTMDEGWAPYVQGQLTLARPDAAVVAALDPREGARVLLTLTRTPGTVLTADLGVRSRTTNDDGEMVLDLASDEAIAQDKRLWSEGTGPVVFGDLPEFVDFYLSLIGAALEPGSPSPPFHTEDWNAQAGDGVWDLIEPSVQQGGLRLYADEERRWWLVGAPNNSVDVVMVSRPTELTDEVSIDEDTWGDGVIIKYTWLAGGVEQHAWDFAMSDEAVKPRMLEYSVPYPGPGAAAHVLSRSLARGRQVTPRLVSNYSTRPGMQLVIPLTDGTLLGGHVAAVTWSIDDDEMTITPRDLETISEHAWVLDTPGVSWDDIPVGVSWLEDI